MSSPSSSFSALFKKRPSPRSGNIDLPTIASATMSIHDSPSKTFSEGSGGSSSTSTSTHTSATTERGSSYTVIHPPTATSASSNLADQLSGSGQQPLRRRLAGHLKVRRVFSRSTLLELKRRPARPAASQGSAVSSSSAVAVPAASGNGGPLLTSPSAALSFDLKSAKAAASQTMDRSCADFPPFSLFYIATPRLMLISVRGGLRNGIHL